MKLQIKCVYSDGETIYRDERGLAHREDGPAIIPCGDGCQAWLKHGEYHRLEGPARVWDDGYEEYWIDGARVDKEGFPV